MCHHQHRFSTNPANGTLVHRELQDNQTDWKFILITGGRTEKKRNKEEKKRDRGRSCITTLEFRNP